MTAPAPPDDLLARATAARARAYAPYSRFLVGAAIETDRGTFEGANVENASYGLAVCAERTAILAAVLAGARRVERIAVATDTSPPAAPCGMCLQSLLEFADDAEVVLGNPAGERRVLRLRELVPHGFRPAHLARPGGGA